MRQALSFINITKAWRVLSEPFVLKDHCKNIVMSLIKNWKKDKNYKDGIELLALFQPDHPLLASLRKKKTAINELYLEQALDKIPTAPLKKKKQIYKKGNVLNAEYLYARLKELYLLKNQKRKGFFTARTNKGRAKINQALIQYRKEIYDLQQKIEYFEETGDLPKIPDVVPKKMVLPKNDIALMKLLYNTRSSISKAKKSKHLAYEAKDKKRIRKYDEKLKLLESKLIEIERQIQNSK